ncbi:MAG: protein serine/threonine phosphatase 2C family protein [Halobacteriovoraceae bacterium]|nr:protein serine/threonine phosphatase 2C family protein [Halobacteriovoraceae bacterium]
MLNTIILNKNEDTEVKSFECSIGTIHYFSLKSPHHNINQDSLAIYQINDSTMVFLVSDGMGGHASGEVASKIICDRFKKELKKKDKTIREKIINAIEKANQEVQDLKSGAGATLSCCMIEKGVIRFFNIGDSSQMLLGSRGKLKYKGIEHSPLGHGIEAGLIEDKKDQDLVEDNLVSNGVGFTDMRIEMSSETSLSDGDLIILATDGVSKSMAEEQFISWASSEEFNLRAQKMRDALLEGTFEHDDDSSLILIRYGKVESKEA